MTTKASPASGPRGRYPSSDLMPGDRVAARRNVHSKIYHNLIVGPIVDVYTNGCVIRCNEGEENETCWTLPFAEWNFQLLFHASDI